MKTKYKNTGFVVRTILLALFAHFVLAYVKYSLNDLSLTQYKYDYIGNVLNMLITILILLGSFVSGFTKNTIDKKRMTFITTMLIFITTVIVIAYIINKFNLVSEKGYIFNIPYKKAITGALFIVSVFMSIYVLIYIWGHIFGIEKLYELRTLVRTFMAFVLLFIFALFYVWNVNSFSENKLADRKFEYGLIPGAAVYSKGKPSPIFGARIRKAFELKKSGRVKNLVLTGGKAPGEITEAEAAMKYLINLGVKPNNLIVENETSTTVEQIKFIKSKLLKKVEFSGVLIISDGFHLSRTLQIGKFFGINADGVSSGYKLSFEKTLFYRTRESIALLLFWFFAI